MLKSFWPSKTLSDRKWDEICQIPYYLGPASDGLMEIRAKNVFMNPALPEADYAWSKMPESYRDYMKLIFFRLELLSFCAGVKGNSRYNEVMQKNLGFLDKVLDIHWELADEAIQEGNMNADWRSEVIDMWLSIEARVGNHEPDTVDAFIEMRRDVDIKGDIFEIGKSLLSLRLCLL